MKEDIKELIESPVEDFKEKVLSVVPKVIAAAILIN